MNLVRVPEAPNKFMSFGNAMHYALKSFFDRFRESDPGVQFLLDRFSESLMREPIVSTDRRDLLTKGNNALSGFYRTYHAIWRINILNEYNINSVLLMDDIKLSGKLDKIEILDLANNVHVVDYKSGKPKTRAGIEGIIKTSDGGYKRQLVFYGLILKLMQPIKFIMKSAEINFIEPDLRGKYHREEYEISDTEIEELKKIIINSAKEILNFEFRDRTCDELTCKYCILRGLKKV